MTVPADHPAGVAAGGAVAKAPKLAEIAKRIQAHLDRMEAAQPNRGTTNARYWHPSSRAAGPRVAVRYISYQYTNKLTKADAWAYLQWLDAGNEGTHYAALAKATQP